MSLQQINILLVEDNPGDARLVEEAFRESAWQSKLHHVMDGVAAMEFLRRQGPHVKVPEPNLVLLDLNLPKMSGREVLAEVKSDPRLSHIPVIALTTSQSTHDIEQCYDLGGNAYLVKPVDLDQFLDAIRKLEEFWFSVATLPPCDSAGFPAH